MTPPVHKQSHSLGLHYPKVQMCADLNVALLASLHMVQESVRMPIHATIL